MTVSTMHRLRAETRTAHERLEESIDLTALTASPERYQALVSRFYGFHAALEPGLMTALAPEYRPVERADLLSHDLQTLGLPDTEIDNLPRCAEIPEHASRARAFGVAYVLEGSALGGQIVGRIVKDRLGYDRDQGAAFFFGQGRHIGEDWRAFGAACDRYFAQHGGEAEAVQAANETFDAIGVWLRDGGLI